MVYTLSGNVRTSHERNNDLENMRVVCVSAAARISLKVDTNNAFVQSHGLFVAG